MGTEQLLDALTAEGLGNRIEDREGVAAALKGMDRQDWEKIWEQEHEMEHPHGPMQVHLQKCDCRKGYAQQDILILTRTLLIFFQDDQLDKQQYDRDGIRPRGNEFTE